MKKLIISLALTFFVVQFIGCSNDDEVKLNEIRLQSVEITGGIFLMGSPEKEPGHNENEIQQLVTIKTFHLSKYEITYLQFIQFLNERKIPETGQDFIGKHMILYYFAEENIESKLIYSNNKWSVLPEFENMPVNWVTWFGANEFAKFVGGRLPTDVEWEYACRAGTTTAFNTGECLSPSLANFYWTIKNAMTCSETQIPATQMAMKVGSFAPNAYGLYDMHGNLNEWCNDLDTSLYVFKPNMEEFDHLSNRHIMRGGSFSDVATTCRSASKMSDPNGLRIVGFRVAFD